MEPSPPIDIVKLAREIAFRMAPDALLDSEDIAAMLRCTPRYVTSRYAHAPGFPKAILLRGANGGVSKPRWRRVDIATWIESHADNQHKIGGRPRLR